MLELDAERFYKASIHLRESEGYIDLETNNGNGDTEIALVQLEALNSSLYQFYLASKNLNADLCCEQIEEFRVPMTRRILELRGEHGYVSIPQVTQKDAASALQNIRRIFMYEIGRTKVLVFERELSGFFVTPDKYFGQEILDAFPDMSDDLEEALRCLSLSRPTASVFHQMRAMEMAVQVIGSKLSAVVKNSDGDFLIWGTILSNMEDKIKVLQSANEKQKWAEIKSMLHSVKAAWRNPSMHPGRHYSVDQSREIIAAVKALLNVLRELV
jgi:hypothetical protein